MPIPAFTLDIGSIFVLVITSLIAVVLRSLHNSIQSGDKSIETRCADDTKRLEERINRLEQSQNAQAATLREVLDHLQRIELSINTWNTRYEMSGTAKKRARP